MVGCRIARQHLAKETKGFVMGIAEKSYKYEETQSIAKGVMYGLERLNKVSADEPHIVDTEQYYSREIMDLEWGKFWKKVWVVAGRVSDIPEVGDFFTFDLGRESFLITRSSEDEIKTFFNVCSHRGNRLVEADYGSMPGGFTCIFHSWKWNIDGSLNQVQDQDTFRPEVLMGDLGLQEVRCDTWGGFVFVCMSDKAPPLHEFLNHAREHTDPYNVEDMRVITDILLELPANWKTGVDAFIEAYHLHAIHPQVLNVIDDRNRDVELYDHGMSLMQAPFGILSPRLEDQESLTEPLKIMLREIGLDPADYEGRAADVRPIVQATKRKIAEENGEDISRFTDQQITDDNAVFFFPNLAFNVHPEGALFMQFLPHPTDPQRFFFKVQILIHPLAETDAHKIPFYMGIEKGADITCKERPEREYELAPAETSALGLIMGQDVHLLDLVQKGLVSDGFEGMRFSEQEIRLRYFHEEIDRYMNDQKW